MNYVQYDLLNQWFDGLDKEDYDFPTDATEAFWDYALYHARMMVVCSGYDPRIGYLTHLTAHLDDALDEYLELQEPVEWLLWLFKREGAFTTDPAYFNIVWWDDRMGYRVNYELARHEFMVQKSDTYPNQFEVQDLDDNCRVLFASYDYDEANAWIYDQLAEYARLYHEEEEALLSREAK